MCGVWRVACGVWVYFKRHIAEIIRFLYQAMYVIFIVQCTKVHIYYSKILIHMLSILYKFILWIDNDFFNVFMTIQTLLIYDFYNTHFQKLYLNSDHVLYKIPLLKPLYNIVIFYISYHLIFLFQFFKCLYNIIYTLFKQPPHRTVCK